MKLLGENLSHVATSSAVIQYYLYWSPAALNSQAMGGALFSGHITIGPYNCGCMTRKVSYYTVTTQGYNYTKIWAHTCSFGKVGWQLRLTVAASNHFNSWVSIYLCMSQHTAACNFHFLDLFYANNDVRISSGPSWCIPCRFNLGWVTSCTNWTLGTSSAQKPV